MKKLYFIIPAVLAVIFLYFYLSEKTRIEADIHKAAEVAAKAAEQRKKERLEDEERSKAEAIVQSAKRAEEREKKRLEDEAQKAEYQAAKDARENAFQESERAYKQFLKLQEDRTVVQDQLKRAKEQAKLQQVQIDYIKGSIKDVTAKKASFEQALSKLEVAERAAAAAEAARAAASATRKS